MPKLWKTNKIKNTEADIKERQWQKTKVKDQFLNVIYDMVLLHIPILYLEGYKELTESTRTLGWPKEPKSIFTSIGWRHNDVFKAWAAQKCEHNTALIIGQHGGHFGMTNISTIEKHQITISDKWISWGWSDVERPKVIPGFNFKEIGSVVTCNPEEGILLVTMAVSRYSNRMMELPSNNQWLSYFDDVCSFVDELPAKLKDKTLVRLSPVDKGCNQRERWNDRFPDIELNLGYGSIVDKVRDARIYIVTYNATTYLESLIWNVPTIMFWDPKHCELKDSVRPYFDLLESVGIFHQTPQAAAHKLEEIWHDIPTWWESNEVQKAREKFCKCFSHSVDYPVDNLAAILRNTL